MHSGPVRAASSPADSDLALATALHEEANHVCFIARSVNFPIRHEPVITLG